MVIDAILAITLPLVLIICTLVYGIGSPFHRHMTGIGLFSILATFSVLMTMALLQALGWFSAPAARLVYILAIMSVTSMTVVIVREQKLGRKEEKAKRAAASAAAKQEGDPNGSVPRSD